MINLLADDRKEQIQAARVNVILARYGVILLLALAFLAGTLFVSYQILQNTKASADAIVESNDIKADVYSETKTEVDTLSTKLNESRAILDQEVRYSHLLTTIGQLMPAGTVIDSLDLNEQSFNGMPIEIKMYAKNNETAVAIRDQLQSAPLFTQVNLKGTDAANGISGYPISVTLSVVLNKAGVR